MRTFTKAYLLKILLIFVVVFLAQFFITENLNGFPYGGAIYERYNLPYVLSAMANFDGVHYTNIAYESYHTYDQAFFPFYPILVRGFGYILGGNHVLSGIIISLVSGYIGLRLFFKLLSEKYDKKFAKKVVLLLLAFPTAFYFQAIYNESLFLAVVVGCLFALHKKKYWWVGILAALASFTRIQGVFLVIPIFIELFLIKKKTKKLWLLLLTPGIGLAVYMVYLYITTGDPLFFFTSQPSFGANRSTNIVLLPQVYYRYLKIFITAQPNFQYFVAVLEFIFFTITFIGSLFVGYKAYVKKNMFEFGLALFSLAYIILPTLTGTFSSIPRYALLAIAIYFIPARLKNKTLLYSIVTISLSLQVLLLSLFARGYFVG